MLDNIKSPDRYQSRLKFINDDFYYKLAAKEKGCVGISLYRNGSLTAQPTQMANQ